MKTESRDRKQKEAAAAFVVGEECGNVEALCQTFLKRGQVTFSQRGKAREKKKKKKLRRGEEKKKKQRARCRRRRAERGRRSGAERGGRAAGPLRGGLRPRGCGRLAAAAAAAALPGGRDFPFPRAAGGGGWEARAGAERELPPAPRGSGGMRAGGGRAAEQLPVWPGRPGPAGDIAM